MTAIAYRALGPFLRELGFRAIAFSYPQRARLGSSSLAWSADSALVNFTDQELAGAFDAVDGLHGMFPVNNARASIADMKRHLRGDPEQFVRYGGYKSFYMDWNFDICRCDAWNQHMCSVWDFLEMPPIRDGCTACVVDCYRDSSVKLHFTVSLSDAIDRLREGGCWRRARRFQTVESEFKLPRVIEAGPAWLNPREACSARLGQFVASSIEDRVIAPNLTIPATPQIL